MKKRSRYILNNIRKLTANEALDVFDIARSIRDSQDYIWDNVYNRETYPQRINDKVRSWQLGNIYADYINWFVVFECLYGAPDETEANRDYLRDYCNSNNIDYNIINGYFVIENKWNKHLLEILHMLENLSSDMFLSNYATELYFNKQWDYIQEEISEQSKRYSLPVSVFDVITPQVNSYEDLWYYLNPALEKLGNGNTVIEQFALENSSLVLAYTKASLGKDYNLSYNLFDELCKLWEAY